MRRTSHCQTQGPGLIDCCEPIPLNSNGGSVVQLYSGQLAQPVYTTTIRRALQSTPGRVNFSKKEEEEKRDRERRIESDSKT